MPSAVPRRSHTRAVPRGRPLLRVALTLLLALTGSTVIVALPATPALALASDWAGSITKASPANKQWMKEIDGARSLADLSIPGTHDSLALCGKMIGTECEAISTGNTQTQESHGWSAETLINQFDAGIRALDIRVRIDTGSGAPKFTIHHGVFYQYANFDDVLVKTRDWLAANKSETVLMSIKAECDGTDRSCEDASGYRTDEAITDTFGSYLADPAYRGLFWSGSVDPAKRSEAIPSLDTVRGRIVLTGFRKRDGDLLPGYGLGPLFPTNQYGNQYVQDDFEIKNLFGTDEKWEKVRTHLRKTNGIWDATRGEQGHHTYRAEALYLNYMSATGVDGSAWPITIASGEAVTGVNEFLLQCLNEDLGRCPEFYADRDERFGGEEGKLKRFGILMMDFPGGHLLDRIIAVNPKDRVPTPPPPTTNPTTPPTTPTTPPPTTPPTTTPPTTTPPTTPPVVPYPSDAKTFTVNANGKSFTTTQPRNSVATYTWTDGQAPRAWLTSAGNGQLNHKMQQVAVAAQAGATDTVSVDVNRTYQTIDGFGGAMTDSAASLILGSAHRDAALNQLFGTGPGQAGLTMVRSPMGSSDMMADGNDFHTYEDTRGSFSAEATASDKRQIEALQRAKTVAGGNFKLIGTPWSAPGWAKRGGSLRPKGCGIEANELDQGQVPAYADYFRKYTAKGIKPWMVSMQNEPQNCKTAMPTTLVPSSTAVALAKQLKSKLPGDVKVLGFDHNWNDKHYVDALTAQSTGRVDAIGYHCYDGTHYATQTTAVATYMTECSGFTDSTANVGQNLGWEVANMLMGPLRHGSKGSIYWSLAQDRTGDPHLNSPDACQTCRGMLTRNADGSFEPSQDFYYFAQFSAFVRPGALRIESTNSGDISTVAFRQGNTTTMVVLVSGTRADGGSAGSDERDLRRHIVQYDGEHAAQKTAWLVGADGYRRWISDGSTFNCLKYDAGMQGPDNVSGGALDKYINLEHVWAVCGAYTMGVNSQLELGTYIKSGGNARLTLTSGGLRATDAQGGTRWAPPGTGDRLILQSDGNLVLYSGSQAVWASGTFGTGAAWLSIRDDGTFILTDKANKKVWVSPTGTRDYRRRIVQYDGDGAAQKTAWLVGNDGNRRWIPDLPTFQCLQAADAGTPMSLSSDVLDTLPNLDGVWAACGADRIGPNGALEAKGHLKAGDYRLTLTASELVLTRNGTRVWAPGKGGEQLKLQTDGNLVMIDKDGRPTWATGTFGKSAGWLVLGTDGSLRLYDAAGKQVWTR